MKTLRKISVCLALGSIIAAPLGTLLPPTTYAQTVAQTNQRKISLGASLTAQEAEMTKQLLGANQLPIAQTLYVDGPLINRYLKDGSNASTPVYSSALLEQLPAGSGVQVQVVTPQNILVVKPTTYQNAAITSGAKDVLIRIATVKPVTGEGALTGIYALFEQAGLKVDTKSILVAEKEIKLVEQAKKENEVTDVQINQIITEIKAMITQKIVDKQPVVIDEIVTAILNKYSNIKLSADTITVLKQVAKEYSETEAAKNKETIEQLDKSINGDMNRPYAVDLNQFGGEASFGRNSDSEQIPPIVYVSLNDNHVEFGVNQGAAVLKTETIDTKEVTVIAEDGSTRKVKVNTVLHLSDPHGESHGMNLEDLYLFFNNEGSISLLTPNYATNDSSAGMLEYKLLQAGPDLDPEVEETPENYPYMVDLNIVADTTHFVREGMNIPTSITLNKTAQTVTHQYPGAEPIASNFTFENVPTHEIVIDSADGSGKRVVNINTVIRPTYGNDTMYLFVNNNGGLSLATPNYAGNSNEVFYLEYLVSNEAPQSTPETTVAETAPVETTVAMQETTVAETVPVETTAAPETTDFPFSVDVNRPEVSTNYYNNNANIPNDITLNIANKTIDFKTADTTKTGTITTESIPTKEIRVFNASDNQIRTVQINTVIKISGLEEALAKELYLFYNANGGLSLATPNYAGNVDAANQDVMLEYLVGHSTPVSANTGDFPYMVDINQLDGEVTVDKEGMNMPNHITINPTDKTIKFQYDHGPETKVGTFEVVNVSTQEIRIYSDIEPSRSEIRTVKVNTSLKLNGFDEAGDLNRDLYLFVNAQGGISLVTTNYPGNTPPDQQDVMMEWILQ